MLFLKAINDLELDDINEFCKLNDEGIRVEYKFQFDNNVRKKIPIIVSSFANSMGGVLIIGVQDDNGKAILPVKGFTKPKSEELRLTIQNICKQSINPPLFPDIAEIQGDAKDNIIIVVSINESVEAPHAIENSRKVYIRTGDSNDPYNLADIDKIEYLLSRRKKPAERKERIIEAAQNRFSSLKLFGRGEPFLNVVISPFFPREPIISLESLFHFSKEYHFKYHKYGICYFDTGFIKRINQGVAGYKVGRFFAEVNHYGTIFLNHKLTKSEAKTFSSDEDKDKIQCLRFYELCWTLGRIFRFAENFYKESGYWGTLDIRTKLVKVANEYLDMDDRYDVNHYQCIDPEVFSSVIASTDELSLNTVKLITSLLKDLVWSFNQGYDNLTFDFLKPKIAKCLKNNRLLD